MHKGMTSLERAFEIARSGKCSTVDKIRKQLKSEGYDYDQICGRSLFRQLRKLIREANEASLRACSPAVKRRPSRSKIDATTSRWQARQPQSPIS